MPFAVRGLVFDGLGASGHALFGGRAAGGGKRAVVCWEASENVPSTV